jgi:hypothetical protein
MKVNEIGPTGLVSQVEYPRPIREIAKNIYVAWGSKVYFGAKPYLDALRYLDTAADSFGQDSGVNVILYFLVNAQTFRGTEARALKAELRLHLPKEYRK